MNQDFNVKKKQYLSEKKFVQAENPPPSLADYFLTIISFSAFKSQGEAKKKYEDACNHIAAITGLRC